MTTQATAAPTDPNTGTTDPAARAKQLLLLLYGYVEKNGPSHPLVLIPAAAGLREAAQFYRRRDFPGAYQQGVAVYQLLLQARRVSPDLPQP